MLEALKAIKEKHLEAKRIIDEANAEADKIIQEAAQQGLREYEIAYKTTIAQAEQKAIDEKRKMAEEAERELGKLLCEAEEQAKEVELKASKNFDKAVDAVFEMVLQ
ncbi:MAG TPA: hypothetical protein VJL33_00335 [Candidatus Bathyarchaeia archaeon]|nr:hypothetical protein [Candidatus Bathyarchaeia archaeon]